MSDDLKDLLKDLILINSIIAIEALQITENTSKIARNSNEIPPQCVKSHGELRNKLMGLLEKYFEKDQYKELKEHVLTH